MTVEVATYITSLQATNPPSSDPRSQGDDHIRLIKSVLQSTFPTATKAFRFPVAVGATTNTTLNAGNQNNFFLCTTGGGSFTIALPTLTSADSGWAVMVAKWSLDYGPYVIVAPPSGNITTSVGAVPRIVVGQTMQPAVLTWDGANWFCFKTGGLIGATESFDGPNIPPGYFLLDGSTYDTVTFCELFAVLGTGTLRDKRGRVDVGSGAGAGLTNRPLNSVFGGEGVALTTTNLPAQTPSGTITNGGITVTIATTPGGVNGNIVRNVAGGGLFTGGSLGASDVTISATATQLTSTFTGIGFAGQNSTPFGIVQPSVASQKIIRAC